MEYDLEGQVSSQTVAMDPYGTSVRFTGNKCDSISIICGTIAIGGHSTNTPCQRKSFGSECVCFFVRIWYDMVPHYAALRNWKWFNVVNHDKVDSKPTILDSFCN